MSSSLFFFILVPIFSFSPFFSKWHMFQVKAINIEVFRDSQKYPLQSRSFYFPWKRLSKTLLNCLIVVSLSISSICISVLCMLFLNLIWSYIWEEHRIPIFIIESLLFMYLASSHSARTLPLRTTEIKRSQFDFWLPASTRICCLHRTISTERIL